MDINFDFIGDPIGGRALENTTHKEASNFGLNPDPQHYFYTRQCKSTITPADKSDFQATVSACLTLGFSSTDLINCCCYFTIRKCNIFNHAMMMIVHVEVDVKDLLTALSKRIIAANGEAEVGRDALAKIVSRVNEALIPYIENDKYKGGTVIGVLDIYGFEIFEQNSFEQFYINY
ncbi:hypothetical protein AGLY_001998 [Aphis glycines]|uniref:Myosin motor domain-containing protein n=1 Tax=Aphis glycines TaxID=307491 RepID=A0A6G0U3S1_APHGL|nr:hypothetical protein AGLY_001998 [Aphis glycines]